MASYKLFMSDFSSCLKEFKENTIDEEEFKKRVLKLHILHQYSDQDNELFNVSLNKFIDWMDNRKNDIDSVGEHETIDLKYQYSILLSINNAFKKSKLNDKVNFIINNLSGDYVAQFNKLRSDFRSVGYKEYSEKCLNWMINNRRTIYICIIYVTAKLDWEKDARDYLDDDDNTEIDVAKKQNKNPYSSFSKITYSKSNEVWIDNDVEKGKILQWTNGKILDDGIIRNIIKPDLDIVSSNSNNLNNSNSNNSYNSNNSNNSENDSDKDKEDNKVKEKGKEKVKKEKKKATEDVPKKEKKLLDDSVRCIALKPDGTRCTRQFKKETPGYCGQHKNYQIKQT